MFNSTGAIGFDRFFSQPIIAYKMQGEFKLLLDSCIAIVEEHLEDDDFSISILARELCMSHSNLYKKIRLISGHSVNSFIRIIRLRKAAELFVNSSGNVNEIAYQVGFLDVRYFRAQFYVVFRMNPSEYIKKYRKTFQ